MSVNHLHLVQCSYQRLPDCLQELTQVYQDNDVICLMEDATLAIYDVQLKQFKKVLLLATDAELIDQSPLPSKHIEMIEYTDLANYIAQANKVLTWR